jgi:hypothetical protein
MNPVHIEIAEDTYVTTEQSVLIVWWILTQGRGWA